jgi:hypothetical protein
VRKSRILVGLILVPLLVIVEQLTYFGVKAPFALFVTLDATWLHAPVAATSSAKRVKKSKT